MTPDWRGFYGDERRLRVPLPTYPFERQRFWIQPSKTDFSRQASAYLRKKLDSADWYYVPSWKMSAPAPAVVPASRSRWLAFVDNDSFSARIVQLSEIAVRKC